MKASLVQGLEQLRTWNRRVEWAIVFGHQSIVPAAVGPVPPPGALREWTTSRKPSPSTSASQMSLELSGQGGVLHAARLASVKTVQVGGSPPPLMYPRI